MLPVGLLPGDSAGAAAGATAGATAAATATATVVVTARFPKIRAPLAVTKYKIRDTLAVTTPLLVRIEKRRIQNAEIRTQSAELPTQNAELLAQNAKLMA